MKEARLRELVKGVYSSSYSNDVAATVNFTHSMYVTRNLEILQMTSETNDEMRKRSEEEPIRSIETEAVILQREANRKKPLTATEKRKRNETLAIGLSRTELLVAGTENNIKGTNKSA